VPTECVLAAPGLGGAGRHGYNTPKTLNKPVRIGDWHYLLWQMECTSQIKVLSVITVGNLLNSNILQEISQEFSMVVRVY